MELTIGVPSPKGDQVSALFLVVPVTDYHKEVPFIVGTNVIRQYYRFQSAEETIPEAWHEAFKSLAHSMLDLLKPLLKCV